MQNRILMMSNEDIKVILDCRVAKIVQFSFCEKSNDVVWYDAFDLIFPNTNLQDEFLEKVNNAANIYQLKAQYLSFFHEYRDVLKLGIYKDAKD